MNGDARSSRSRTRRAQAIDRVHRIGQENKVFVYRLVAAGTIEERIQQLKRQKSHLFQQTVGDLEDVSDIKTYFSSLRELIDLRDS